MKTESLTIGFIGAGRITQIILSAWKKSNIHFKDISVFDLSVEKAEKIVSTFENVKVFTSPAEVISNSQIAFLALHPPVFNDVLSSIKDSVDSEKLLISLAPKISIAQIQQILGKIPVARVIPNAPSVIGKGYNVFAVSDDVAGEKMQTLNLLFEHLGEFKQVDEAKLEAYATITGMGPTYLWFLFDEIYNQAKTFGLNEQNASEAVNQMIVGASETLFNSNLSKEEVLNLIPAYPLKPQEETVKTIYSEVICKVKKNLTPDF